MKHDCIGLTLPAKADYILTVRMLVASIASRMDFSIDSIEDLKAGAAEACILFLTAKKVPQTLKLEVTVGDEFALQIVGDGELTERTGAQDEGDELAKCLIEEFYDDATYNYNGDTLAKIELKKRV